MFYCFRGVYPYKRGGPERVQGVLGGQFVSHLGQLKDVPSSYQDDYTDEW